MRNSIIYILLSLVLAVSCTKDEIRPYNDIEGNKVIIDLSVQIHDPSVATKALAQKPKLRNLMVAVFDASGYLLEYTFAIEINLATENSTNYDYKVAITQSDEPRIIHFIGNAPDKLNFGVEETVLASIKSSIGVKDDDGIYWCRREVPSISGTNSGGAMLLADDGGNSNGGPIYQADLQTRAYFSNVGLIRNFSQIELKSSSEDFELEKYYIVGTPKEGLASAYNYSTGRFMNYYKGNVVTGNEDTGYTFNLGAAKTFNEIIDEGYDANVLPTAQKFKLEEYVNNENWISKGASAFVFECEKPLKAEDAVYIIVYGQYKGDNKNYYYKIDLRDANGYFPIIRNFKYTINITEVSRPGYETIDKAASSAGSGDISTSLETKSLAYISDGVASLEVEYIEKYIVNSEDVTLDYTFLDNVETSNPGDYKKMWVIVNEAGSTGAAIASINGNAYTVGNKIEISQNPGALTISPTALTDVPKSQTLTIFAEYTNEDASHILQRTVNFIVQSKRTMLVSLAPSEVPNIAGSEFDVNISLPAGLSKSIFPLEFLIESGSLSINPHNDQMPVRSGATLIDNSGRSSFYFVKTFEYNDYNPESGALNTVNCHFKTIKAQGATHIYAANPYFETTYDYEGTVSNEDANGNSVYLDTYSPYKFSMLSFSSESVGVGENVPVNVGFNMDRIPEDGIVYVSLGNLAPASTETQLTYEGLKNGKVIYSFRPTYTSATLALQTAHFDGELSVDLSAYHFIPASESAQRSLYTFSGSYDKDYILNAASGVNYTFSVPYCEEGMVIEVELQGFTYASDQVPDNWENGLYLGNNVYAFKYKPTSEDIFNKLITLKLYTDISNPVNGTEYKVKLNAPGYKELTSSIYYRRFDFTSNWSRNELSSNNNTVNYTFNIPTYIEGMKVYVTLNNGLTFNGNLPNGWTNGSEANTYIYTPTASGNVTISLKSGNTNVANGTEFSVTLNSDYYNEHTSSTIKWTTAITIPAGNLVTNAARNNAFSIGTIYLYTTSNYSDTPVGYSYDRSTYTVGRNSYYNGTATNNEEITLTGVNAESTIYLQYVNGTRTWRGSFKLSDATDDNGANITLREQ